MASIAGRTDQIVLFWETGRHPVRQVLMRRTAVMIDREMIDQWSEL